MFERELTLIVQEEVRRLPARYRAAVVLCYLEGLTHEMAAEQLGWPVGSVKSRLAWARERLRIQLTRRGVAPGTIPFVRSGSATDPEFAPPPCIVPATLVDVTIRGALKRRSWKECFGRDRLGRSHRAIGRGHQVHDECQVDARGGYGAVRRPADRRSQRDELFRDPPERAPFCDLPAESSPPAPGHCAGRGPADCAEIARAGSRPTGHPGHGRRFPGS